LASYALREFEPQVLVRIPFHLTAVDDVKDAPRVHEAAIYLHDIQTRRFVVLAQVSQRTSADSPEKIGSLVL